MNWNTVLPSAVALLAALAAARAQRTVRPDWATWTLTLLTAAATFAVVWACAVLAAGFALEQPSISGLFGWCAAVFPSHDRVPTPVGMTAWMALVVMSALAARRLCLRRRATHGASGHVFPDSRATAFAIPGGGGRIVVSPSMLAALDSAERDALLAHERSHLRHHHHRFLDVAESCAAAFPPLQALSRQVRFATERWADEDAAAEVGDRRIVARAIARAALAARDTAAVDVGAMAFAGYGTVARVEAMLAPSPRINRTTIAWIALGSAGVAVSLSGSTVQLHHLVEFIGHICGVR